MQKISNDALGRPEVEEYKNLRKHPLVVVLDNIRSLSNIGSVFRTCDAMAVEKILLCGITATPPHREIHKTALGATESVDWAYFETTPEAIHWLRKHHYKVVSVEQARPSIWLGDFTFSTEEPVALVFGNEVMGVSDEVIALSDSCLEIPQWGTKHSLNISVSVGIVLWELVRQVN